MFSLNLEASHNILCSYFLALDFSDFYWKMIFFSFSQNIAAVAAFVVVADLFNFSYSIKRERLENEWKGLSRIKWNLVNHSEMNELARTENIRRMLHSSVELPLVLSFCHCLTPSNWFHFVRLNLSCSRSRHCRDNELLTLHHPACRANPLFLVAVRRQWEFPIIHPSFASLFRRWQQQGVGARLYEGIHSFLRTMRKF